MAQIPPNREKATCASECHVRITTCHTTFAISGVPQSSVLGPPGIDWG